MYTIVVTGVGAIIGYGIIRSLRVCKYPVKIIGLDIYADAVGQNWCDHFEQAVLTSSVDYPDFISDILKKYSADLVIPGIEQDACRMTIERNLWTDSDVKFVINNQQLVETADDKWETYLKLVEAGFSTIKTHIDGDFPALAESLGSPMLLKPRRSYASKGIQRLYNEEEFLYWKKKMGANFMVQEIVGDDEAEYTVGAFGLGNGNCSGKISLRRKLSGEGATVKAETVFIPELDQLVDDLVFVFRPEGPTNFQFRYHQGNFLLLEINPRVSSSTSLRTAFGYNEAEMCIEYYLRGKIPETPHVRSGNAIRYIEDCIIYDSNNI